MTNKKEFTNKYQRDVALFHKTAGHPIEYVPTVIGLERSVNRTIWTVEELVEYLHASCSNLEEFKMAYDKLLFGMNKAFAKSEKQPFPKTEKERVVGQSDALGDANYFINGTADEMGVDLEPIHDAIQKANMSKFYQNEDGTYYAKFREDGKILKAPGFAPPEEDIKQEIEHQLKGKMEIKEIETSILIDTVLEKFGSEIDRDKYGRIKANIHSSNSKIKIECVTTGGSLARFDIQSEDLLQLLDLKLPTTGIVETPFIIGMYQDTPDNNFIVTVKYFHYPNPKVLN